MKCDLFKDKILECFGDSELPEEIKEHLNHCSECSQYYKELLKLSKEFDKEDAYYPTKEEQNKFVSDLEKKIDRLELKKVTDITPKWKTYIPVAAVIVMILGLALVSQLGNLFNSTDQTNIAENTDSIWINIDKDEIEFVNNENFDNVLIDYSSLDNSLSNELYIQNVSEEEYQYLLDNFDIGEIL